MRGESRAAGGIYRLFSLGEGEEITKEIIDCYRQAKKDGCTKQEFLLRVSKIDGVYVPSPL